MYITSTLQYLRVMALCISLLFLCSNAFCQTANTNPPNVQVLKKDLNLNTLWDMGNEKTGILLTRLSATQLKELNTSTLAAGTIIYNTTAHMPMYYTGSQWRTMADKKITDKVDSLSASEIKNLAPPLEGTTIYNTTLKKHAYYNGTQWILDNGTIMK